MPGHEMGICHISKTTGPILKFFIVYEKMVTCDMISNFYDRNRSNRLPECVASLFQHPTWAGRGRDIGRTGRPESCPQRYHQLCLRSHVQGMLEMVTCFGCQGCSFR